MESRVQLPKKNVGMYTEEMTRLFRHAGPETAEDKEIRFHMLGVKQELFAKLIHHQLKYAHEFLTEAITIDKALEMRTMLYNRRS